MTDEFNIDDLFGEEEEVLDGENDCDIGSLFDDYDDADGFEDRDDFSFEGNDVAFKKYQNVRPRFSSLFVRAASPKK